jgi:hypothetical protein
VRKQQPRISRIILKICSLNHNKAEKQNSKDAKMQKRSHQVVENTGSGLGSFSKRTHFPARTKSLDRRITRESGIGLLPIADCELPIGRSMPPRLEFQFSNFDS